MSTQNTNQLIITRPDDWHLHLRDGAALEAVVADTARQFARAIIMPNLKPPVTTTEPVSYTHLDVYKRQGIPR